METKTPTLVQRNKDPRQLVAEVKEKLYYLLK